MSSKRHRADYEKLGVSIDKTCSRLDSRHYPFGPTTEHLLGDLRTGEKFHATNASLVEHDANAKLQGFKDYPRTRRLRTLSSSARKSGHAAVARPRSDGSRHPSTFVCKRGSPQSSVPTC